MKTPSIQLSGTKGDSLFISIANYSYPDIDEDYDGNYLDILIKAKNEKGKWQGSSSCLLTWEVKWFSKWLKYVVEGEMEVESLTVLDQDFGLKYLDFSNGFYCFVAILKYGLMNKKECLEKPNQNDSSILYLSLNKDDLRAFISFFENTFEIFPPRGKQGLISLEKLPGPQRIK
jgi:hypothetical protein